MLSDPREPNLVTSAGARQKRDLGARNRRILSPESKFSDEAMREIAWNLRVYPAVTTQSTHRV